MKEIPEFLLEFIGFSRNGYKLSVARTIDYLFYFDPASSSTNNHLFQNKLFTEFYLLAKKNLNLIYNSIDHDYFPLKKDLPGETDFLALRIAENEITTIPVVCDMPVYWYNSETKELGQSILPGAFRVIFMTYPNTVIVIHYEFNLFSNHIIRVQPYYGFNRELYYFEPAAHRNRALIRNFAIAIKEKFPDLTVEFVPERCRVYPRDNLGFLNGADVDFNL